MSDRAVLQINLESPDFEQFQKKFAEYQGALSQTADKWKDIGKGIGDVDFDKLNEFVKKHEEAMDAVLNKQKDEETGARRLADAWSTVTSSSAKFAGHVLRATVALGKWGGITSVFSSIFASGGLMGLGQMAANASRERATSSGLGVTFGERQAFDSSFSRLGNTDAILEWVGDLQRNPEDRWALGAISGSTAGAERLTQMSTSDAAAALLPMIQARMKAAPATGLDQVAKAFGIPVDLARVLRSMSTAELTDLLSHYKRNTTAMSLPAGVLKKWNDLNTKFAEAETTIESKFTNKLVKLVPEFEYLTKSVSSLLDKLMEKGGVLEDAIKPVREGLDWLSKKIASPEFEKGVDELAGYVKKFCDSAAKLTGTSADVKLNPITISGGRRGFMMRGRGGDGGGGGGGGGGPSAVSSAEQRANAAAWKDEIRKAGYNENVVAASLGSVQTESTFSPRAHNNQGGGHTGHWQWDRVRWPKIERWILEHKGNPYDTRWQARAWIAEHNARPGEPLYDSRQTETAGRIFKNNPTLEEAITGVRLSERFGRGEEGGRAVNARKWLSSQNDVPLEKRGFLGARYGGEEGPPVATGQITPGLERLRNAMQKTGTISRFTSFNDEFHHRVAPKSKHALGLAMDAVGNPDKIMAEYRAQMDRAGLKEGVDYYIQDEYRHPSPHATGGHVHFQFNTPKAADFYSHLKTSALHPNARHWENERKVARVDIKTPHGLVVA